MEINCGILTSVTKKEWLLTNRKQPLGTKRTIDSFLPFLVLIEKQPIYTATFHVLTDRHNENSILRNVYKLLRND
jgi:hypothetical protein